MNTKTAEAVKIDPMKIPNYAYKHACSLLNENIRRALSDPAMRDEYERWKRKRQAKTDGTEV